MTAGARSALVTLQTYSSTQDSYGEEVSSWATASTEWAQVFYGRGDERRQAAMTQGQQPATFQVLSNEATRSITLRDRLVLEGFAWDIVGIAPDWPKRGLIELTATLTSEAVDLTPATGGFLDFSDPANSGLLALFDDEFGVVTAPTGGVGQLDFSDPAQSGHLTPLLEDA
jgi:head-tail adaptor